MCFLRCWSPEDPSFRLTCVLFSKVPDILICAFFLFSKRRRQKIHTAYLLINHYLSSILERKKNAPGILRPTSDTPRSTAQSYVASYMCSKYIVPGWLKGANGPKTKAPPTPRNSSPNVLLASDYGLEWIDIHRKDLSLPPFHSICCVYFPCILGIGDLSARYSQLQANKKHRLRSISLQTWCIVQLVELPMSCHNLPLC